MRAKGHVFCLWSEKNPVKKEETDICQIGPCLPPACTGCLVGLGTFPAGLVGLGTHFHHNIAFFNENTCFYSVFNGFGVCCWKLCFWLKCFNTAYIPGFWARYFQTLIIKMLKVFIEIPIFVVFGGLTLIDWTSKPLLQSFNFRSFFGVFGLKSVWLE